MSATEKFMFDTIFDELDQIIPEVAEEEPQDISDSNDLLEPETEREEVPTFSAEDVEAARQEGFADGKEQGITETLDGIEKRTEDSINSMSGKIDSLFEKQDHANREISDDATALSLAVVRKFFPALKEAGAIEEITLTLEHLLQRLNEEPRIQLKANPEIRDELTSRLNKLTENKGYLGTLTVIADENIQLGDCEIEWLNGTARRDLTALTAEIDSIVAQNSTKIMDSLTILEAPDAVEEKNNSAEEPLSDENKPETLENSDNPVEIEAQIEPNVNDAEVELSNQSDEEIIGDMSETESDIDVEGMPDVSVDNDNK